MRISRIRKGMFFSSAQRKCATSNLRPALLSPGREDLTQLLRRDYLELLVRAIPRLLVRAPATELRGVTEAIALHVLVRNLQHHLRTNWLPRKILAAAP